MTPEEGRQEDEPLPEPFLSWHGAQGMAEQGCTRRADFGLGLTLAEGTKEVHFCFPTGSPLTDVGNSVEKSSRKQGW